ncbi:MAG TPA: tetratricopeptide repeat protein, partial [Nitrospira sp.]|nr:tetratricopeptide repeat protein [Nitrospira sp.]
MRTDKRSAQKADKKTPSRVHKRGVVGYSKKSALLEEAITHMNTGKYGRSSAALKELLALDPHNTEARRLFATLHLKLGSLVTARQAFESLANEAIGRQDYWLAESLLREYLAAGPRCVPFLELLAHVYQEKGDEMAAVGELGKAIEILRDDPDSDNPQKAAQFYAKIRELAPASSVALELAPLFDVQTGEFLVRPSGVHQPVSGNDAGLHESAASVATEHPLPEVMPWEVIDESPTSDSQPSSTIPTAGQSPDLSADQIEDPLSMGEYEQDNRNSDSLSSTTVAPSDESTLSHDELDSTGAASTLDTGEPELQELVQEQASENRPGVETGSGAGLPSPMPWEQMADASIQIAQPEAPLSSDPHLALESILASFREQDLLTAPPVTNEESQAPPIEMAAPAVPHESMESTAGDPSTQLSSPMPWEQISDGEMQIPEAESSAQPASPAPLQEAFSFSSSPSLTEEAGNSPSALVCDPVPTDSADSLLTVTDPEHLAVRDEQSLTVQPLETESAPGSVAEAPRESTFSWNSVFDKAWKFAAGTMAPSPERELDTNAISNREEDSVTPAPPMPAESPAPELSPYVSLSTSDAAPPLASVTPAMPASFSTVVEEQTIPEVAGESLASVPVSAEIRLAEEPPPSSTVPLKPEEPPSRPKEIAPPVDAPSHWNTGEVAVQVHRPSKKKKRWEKEPKDAEQTPAIPTSALESISETLSEAIREWKSTPIEAVGSSVPEGVAPKQDASCPDWMQASETITFNAPAPAPEAPALTLRSWSDSGVVPTREHVEPTQTPAASAVDVLFSSDSAADHFTTHERPSWSKPRPRIMARLHRVRIGVSSFIGSCFSTTRSLTFLALMLAVTVVVVAATGIGAVGLAWMAMEVPPSPVYHNLTVAPPRLVT